MTMERAVLCDSWLTKVNATYAAYRRARDHRQEIQDEAPHLPQSDGGFAFRRALSAETHALSEYREALSRHYQIIVEGRLPR